MRYLPTFSLQRTKRSSATMVEMSPVVFVSKLT